MGGVRGSGKKKSEIEENKIKTLTFIHLYDKIEYREEKMEKL